MSLLKRRPLRRRLKRPLLKPLPKRQLRLQKSSQLRVARLQLPKRRAQARAPKARPREAGAAVAEAEVTGEPEGVLPEAREVPSRPIGVKEVVEATEEEEAEERVPTGEEETVRTEKALFSSRMAKEPTEEEVEACAATEAVREVIEVPSEVEKEAKELPETAQDQREAIDLQEEVSKKVIFQELPPQLLSLLPSVTSRSERP